MSAFEESLEIVDSLMPRVHLEGWYATYVRSNHEKSVEKQLRMKGIETFLPLVVTQNKWKNRVTAKVEIPMFPCYLFVRVARRQCVKVLEVPMVHAIVGNGREYLEVDGAIVEALRIGLREGKAVLHPNLKEGDRARICSGPFAGLEGVIVRVNNQLKVVLGIEQVGRSFALHVSAEELELLRS